MFCRGGVLDQTYIMAACVSTWSKCLEKRIMVPRSAEDLNATMLDQSNYFKIPCRSKAVKFENPCDHNSKQPCVQSASCGQRDNCTLISKDKKCFCFFNQQLTQQTISMPSVTIVD